MFSVRSNPQLNKESFVFGAHFEYPYFTRTVFNNGILGYVDYLDEEHKIAGNSLAVGMLGMQFFYMRHDFYAGQFTKTVFPKFDGFNEKIGLYFAAVFNKVREHFLKGLVRDFERLFKTFEIPLPVVNKGSRKIDFAYMEAYIRELEAARVRELERWLNASGFDNYRLTAAERKAINDYCVGNVPTAGFRVGALFDIHPTRAYKLTNAKLFAVCGTNPVVTNGSVNNGIGGYSSLPCTEDGNMITFSDTTTAEAIFYQPKAFVGYPHVQGLYSLSIRWTDRQLLYIASLFRKMAVGLDFDYAHKFTRKIAADMELRLPVVARGSREIDFGFMDRFVCAVMKLAIRGVVEWKDREIVATKKAVVKPFCGMIQNGDAPEESDWEDRLAAFEDTEG